MLCLVRKNNYDIHQEKYLQDSVRPCKAVVAPQWMAQISHILAELAHMLFVDRLNLAVKPLLKGESSLLEKM